ncbi:hypothetical protein [Micromonospora cathayae]|uniref:Uncharacterized protein n=1 Tax=Micromonospora cathayae TaxID=3028804 RepID=A0ABY7ZXE0_9ACTN|nr:hypothetical protein [Micromonospora sp. HUAS 3]WDZ87740.1 hypothetical protein PVK37_15710 [Micromonospora sp. HUAS 3]
MYRKSSHTGRQLGRIASCAGSRRVDVSVLGATVVFVEHASAAFLPDR